MDNRAEFRRPIEMLFNKYLAGYPYLCRTVDLSCDGLRAESFVEPDDAEDAFPLELRLPQDRETMWIWARLVWERNGEQALRFHSMRPCDRARLEKFLVPSTDRPLPVFPEELYDA